MTSAKDEIRKAKYVYIEGYLFAGDSAQKAALKVIHRRRNRTA